MAFSGGGGGMGPAGPPGAPGAPGVGGGGYGPYTHYERMDAGSAKIYDRVGTLLYTSVLGPADAANWSLTALGVAGGGELRFEDNVQFLMEDVMAVGDHTKVWLGQNTELKWTASSQAHCVWMAMNKVDAHIIGNGNSILNFNDVAAGIWMPGAAWCSLEFLEMHNGVNGGSVNISASGHDNLLLKNYIHHYGAFMHAISISSGSRNRIVDCVTDGNGEGNTRCGLCLGGSDAAAYDNEVLGGFYMNSAVDNGIYLGGWEYVVEGTKLIGVTSSGNHDNGHAGIKLRPASRSEISGCVCHDNFNGMEIGTAMPTESGGDSEYNKISVSLIHNDSVGLILFVDDDSHNVRYNRFDIEAVNNGSHGVWVSADKATCEIAHNEINLISNANVRNGIFLEPAHATGFIRWNRFTGEVDGNGWYGIDITGANSANAEDNYLALKMNSNTTARFRDNGVRTRFNGFGDEVKGASGVPVNANWHEGDIVRNTNDNTVWILDRSSAWRQIL